MSVELIGIIAATIALGTAMLASTRSIRQDVRDQRSELLDRMTAMESNLRGRPRRCVRKPGLPMPV